MNKFGINFICYFIRNKQKRVLIKNILTNKKGYDCSSSGDEEKWLGRHSYYGVNFIKMHKASQIGAFCSIGHNVSIGPSQHPKDWLSTSPFQYVDFKKIDEQQTWDGYNVGMSLYKRSGWMSPMMYLIASFGIATVLGFGNFLINSGQMTAGSFASFVTSLLLLYKPVKSLGNTLTGIQGIFVAMGRVFELFDLEPEIKDCPNAKILNGLNKSIKFENVNFEYVPNLWC